MKMLNTNFFWYFFFSIKTTSLFYHLKCIFIYLYMHYFTKCFYLLFFIYLILLEHIIVKVFLKPFNIISYVTLLFWLSKDISILFFSSLWVNFFYQITLPIFDFWFLWINYEKVESKPLYSVENYGNVSSIKYDFLSYPFLKLKLFSPKLYFFIMNFTNPFDPTKFVEFINKFFKSLYFNPNIYVPINTKIFYSAELILVIFLDILFHTTVYKLLIWLSLIFNQTISTHFFIKFYSLMKKSNKITYIIFYYGTYFLVSVIIWLIFDLLYFLQFLQKYVFYRKFFKLLDNKFKILHVFFSKKKNYLILLTKTFLTQKIKLFLITLKNLVLIFFESLFPKLLFFLLSGAFNNKLIIPVKFYLLKIYTHLDAIVNKKFPKFK